MDLSGMQWRSLENCLTEIPLQWRLWLADIGSLTQRLIQTYNNSLRISVLKQVWEKPSGSEQQFLGQSCSQASVREVLIICKDRPRIFARSIFPRTSLGTTNAHLLTLGNTPLGHHLFLHNQSPREKIEVASITADNLNQITDTKIHSVLHNKHEKIWARRSLFCLNNKPISVCEFFLPTLLAHT
ncbi:Chorismate pyruvate-lyase [invertebrate metagenome]|uniref:Chorismate pyruvate-lyase n=1 Tax=invertebrate metagenome TaxID=1711999 RepID=A0A2H9T7F3_9ZZZZ